MIRKINATIEDFEDEKVLIKIGALTLEAYPSFNVIRYLKKGDKYEFFASLEMNEWNTSLYIFKDKIERDVFESLKKVSKIGPRIASKILRKTDAKEFIEMINAQDTTLLSNLPGIGRKTAERLISELSNSFNAYSAGGNTQSYGNKNVKEAIEALEALGFQRHEIMKVIGQLDLEEQKTEEIIKECLTRL
ncbi:Holliday junction branch migration protein RuvA [Petrotoga halophila]|uniref:Holliday junction branch migration protein RuvA n=1 Tax=Petrotoga halophila TaxID=301141 RepID=UPI000CDEC291|nr:Holliday junction branch migration protein RuvA [Petrotoga halophila]MDN5345572.1 holliday junction helicase RuvA [Petrotoga sp.]